KIRHIGVSILGKGSELQAREAAKSGAEALQVVYNRLDRRPEQIYFPHARRDNLGILARVPMASGLLSGKYKPGTNFAANDVRATFDAEKMKTQLAEAEQIKKTEVPAGVPMSQWALAWCLKDPLVSAVIPGCKNPAQVKANALAAELVAD
ncbi:MAG TPA: aldo/keto reductase, partial [Candidatus Baltobacteraceae bacterium]|nr:aldo/keto reductase [Candidatus Baltobacteraceae bacterium]